MTSQQPYPTRHYAVAEFLLTLRSRARLTQAALASQIGIHRRSVQKWESGETYPTADNLHTLIGIFIELAVFTPEHEQIEATSLWDLVSRHAPQQFPPFDASWFAQQLARRAAGSELTEPVDNADTPQPKSAPVVEPPPEPTAQRQPFALPPHSTILIGRETEQAAVAKLLASPACRLLTLLGPGGIGKTRLALTVAAAHSSAFRDGVAFVDLAALTTVEQMVLAIGDALQLPFAGRPDPTAELLAALRPRHLLLLLDDFEHLLDGTDLVVTLLHTAPELTILVTSQVRLNLQAEWLFDVDPLTYPPANRAEGPAAKSEESWTTYSALQLFVQRATQVQPSFALSPRTLQAVTHICQEVDGNPLAIELAAASLRSLSLGEIERQIASNLALLATTLRDLPPRHRSMQAVFDHAWALLTERERVILGRLAVFRGGWDQAAAEAICAQVTSAMTQARAAGLAEPTFPHIDLTFSPVVLAALVDKSLVRRHTVATPESSPHSADTSDEPRYRLLEPIRNYALAQLAARGEASVLQRAHATYYMTLAETVTAQWLSANAPHAIAQLDREHDNLRAALQWACDSGAATVGLRLAGALIKFWRRRGAISEGRTWLEALLKLTDDAPDAGAQAARLHALQSAAWLASDQLDYTRASELFEQSLLLQHQLGDTSKETDLLVNTALQARAMGHYSQAAALLENALAQQRALGNRSSFDNRGLGLTLFFLGLVHREQGDFVRAMLLLTECMELHRALGDPEGTALGLLALSDIARDQGDLAHLHSYATQSLAVLRELKVQWALGFALNNLALAAHREGSLPQAAKLIHESIAIFRAQHADGSLAEGLVTLGQVLAAQGDAAAAHAALLEALHFGWNIGPRLMVAAGLEVLAGLVVQSGGTQSATVAVQALATASALREQMGAPVRPADRPAIEATWMTIRATFDAAAISKIWATTTALSLPELIRLFSSQPTSSTSATATARAAPSGEAMASAADPAHALPTIDWGLAQDVPVLYGRAEELATLTQWVLADRCRVITLVGLGGIGKTSLALTLAKQVAPHFATVLFRSLGEAPPFPDLLDQLIHKALPTQQRSSLDTGEKLELLIDLLRQKRVLIILDNLETLLQMGGADTPYLAGYAEYETLLKAIGETAHQSCLILTSRERPHELSLLEGAHTPVRTLRLDGLAEEACQALLGDQNLSGTAGEAAMIAQRYGGNPLALKLIGDPIRVLFHGSMAAFLAEGNLFFNGVGQLLARQIDRTSPLEQEVLMWLTLARVPISLDQLMTALTAGVQSIPRASVLAALHALWRRNLIELGQVHLTFTLQPVVLEYLTEQLIEQVAHELGRGEIDRVRRYALIQATAKEYVRRSQERLVAQPLLDRLVSTHGDKRTVEQHLLSLLRTWRQVTKDDLTAELTTRLGYAPGNVINLLRLLRGQVTGLDLSHLPIRQMYLQGVDAQDALLTRALLQECVFTETFDEILAVAMNNKGGTWAAASRRGEIRLWEDEGRILRLVWRAHTEMIWALALSPDGHLLASGGWDNRVKVWEIATGALRWAGQHTNHINSVAFSPDGSVLASSGHDATVLLWDAQSGTQLQHIAHPTPVFSLAWSPDGCLLASGDMAGTIRLWEPGQPAAATDSAICRQTLVGHKGYIDSLAFTPDGKLLASGSWDGTVKLWHMTPEQVMQGTGATLHATLTGHSDRVRRVAWSPDGQTLVSSGRDRSIFLWDREQSSYQIVLQGHIGEVWTVAFTPDGRSLLTGSEDGRLRLWDTQSGQCTRVIQGHATALYDVAWSPDDTEIAACGLDGWITIYTLSDDLPRVVASRTLGSATGVVYGLSWGHGNSPDSRRLATSAVDTAVCIWHAEAEDVRAQLHYANDVYPFFRRLAWSPDGQRLAIGTYRNGVQLFALGTQHLPWRAEPVPLLIRQVAWHPDGAQLAGAGDDGVIYLWDTVEGALGRQLAHHYGMITSLAWHTDGVYLVSGGRGREGGELFVWNTATGELITTFLGHPEIVSAAAWAAGDDQVVSGGGGGRLRWWDIQSGVCVRVVDAHEGTVQALRRSSDGTKLASCGDDGAIRIWDAASGEHLQTIRRDRPYERLNISGIRGLTAAQRVNLLALGAIDEEAND